LKHNPGALVSLLLAGLVTLIAVSLGCVFLFTDVWIEDFPNNRPIAGALFVAYGLYRAYMGWRRYKATQQEPENEH
jgi:type VI protein secretion system component VasK